jgi:head-tail adaptor
VTSALAASAPSHAPTTSATTATTAQRAAEQQQRSHRLAAPATADPLAAMALEFVSKALAVEAVLQMESRRHALKLVAQRDTPIFQLTTLNAALARGHDKLCVDLARRPPRESPEQSPEPAFTCARRLREPDKGPADGESGEPSARRFKHA